MKIDDIIFIAGLVIISSLLVFVMYDDVTTIQYKMSLEEINQNITNTINISNNNSSIYDIMNQSYVDSKQKTSNTPNSTSTIINNQVKTKTNSLTESSIPKNNEKSNNVHIEDLKNPKSYNNYNEKEHKQSGMSNNNMRSNNR